MICRLNKGDHWENYPNQKKKILPSRRCLPVIDLTYQIAFADCFLVLKKKKKKLSFLAFYKWKKCRSDSNNSEFIVFIQ